MRFWELDLIKGIAIILAMLFHGAFDLAFFAHFPIDTDSWLWWSIARTTSFLFIITAGLSLSISFQKVRSFTLTFLLKVLLRSLKLLILGMFITLTTWFFVGEGMVLFGILHFLAVAPVCGLLLVYYPAVTFLIACTIFLCTPWVQSITVNTSAFIWLGFQPNNFYSLDHFPFFPWLGVYLLGIVLGPLLYPNARRRIPLAYPSGKIRKSLIFIGHHTLILYFLHQPLLLALIYIFVPSSRAYS